MAPLLNALTSRRLEAEGFTTVISVVDSMNRPSLNLARKIGAIPQRQNLYVGLFGRWEWNWQLEDLKGAKHGDCALPRRAATLSQKNPLDGPVQANGSDGE